MKERKAIFSMTFRQLFQWLIVTSVTTVLSSFTGEVGRFLPTISSTVISMIVFFSNRDAPSAIPL